MFIGFGTRERWGEEGGLSCHGHCELDTNVACSIARKVCWACERSISLVLVCKLMILEECC